MLAVVPAVVETAVQGVMVGFIVRRGPAGLEAREWRVRLG